MLTRDNFWNMEEWTMQSNNTNNPDTGVQQTKLQRELQKMRKYNTHDCLLSNRIQESSFEHPIKVLFFKKLHYL